MPAPVIPLPGEVTIPPPACTFVSVPGALLVTHAVVATLVLLSLLATVGAVNSVLKFVAELTVDANPNCPLLLL